MTAAIKTPFSRQVEILNIQRIKSQLIEVRARLINNGELGWNRSPVNERNSICKFGYRLICHEGKFPLTEKLIPLDQPLIAPGDETVVRWVIPIPQISSLFRLEIDVVSISNQGVCSWFSDMGLIPAALELKTPQPEEGSTPYNSRFSDVAVRMASGSLALISGFIKNTGSEPWNASSSRTSDFYLGLRVFNSASLDLIVWEGRGHLENASIAPRRRIQFLSNDPL